MSQTIKCPEAAVGRFFLLPMGLKQTQICSTTCRKDLLQITRNATTSHQSMLGHKNVNGLAGQSQDTNLRVKEQREKNEEGVPLQ